MEEASDQVPEITPESCEERLGRKAPDEEPQEKEAARKKESHKEVGRRGMGLGFLLQQMRSSTNTSQSIQPSRNANPTNQEVVKAAVVERSEKEVVLVQKAPRLRSRIDYNFSDATAAIGPIQEVRQCFNEGTAPNFGFSNRVKENNYVRSCKWSPDGNWLTTDSEDRRVRIFKFDQASEKVQLHGSVRSGDLIYQVQWHPTEDLFATTSKDHPIHLWDSDGNVKLSFRGINNMDELASAYSMAFSLDGQTLYGGYYKSIRIFNLNRPGRQIKEIKTFERGKLGGQKAILSCFSMCPTFAGCYAVGCFQGSIGLYSDQTGSCDCLFATGATGVTHVEYSSDGNYLFCGYRKCDFIECFDLRFPGNVLSKFHRPANTNQRIHFQLDSCDRYLISGSSSGEILIFDLKQGTQINSLHEQEPVQAGWSVRASKAGVPGLSLHPDVPIVAVSCGQRVFPAPMNASMSSSESEGEEVDVRYCSMKEESDLDNALKLWKF